MDSTFFLFDKRIYKQTFDTLGSSISPIFADLILEDLENSALNNSNLNIKCHFKYVDDTFIIVKKTP